MTISGSTARFGLLPALAWALLCIAGSGCDLFSDLDRFEQRPEDDDDPREKDAGRSPTDAGGDDAGAAPDLGCANAQTLCVRLERFTAHVDELVTVDLVTVADNILRARAVIEPLGSVDAEFVLPLAIPETEVPEDGEDHPLHIEIFGDEDKSGDYTPGDDHEWNVDLPPDGTLVFVHSSTFTSIDPRPRSIGGDFRMRFRDMTPHIGQMLEVMVIEAESGRTVGLYRNTSLQDAEFEVVIPGIIDLDGTVYRIEFYADLNGNGTYDDPPVDHTWEIEFVESGQDGVEAEFTHGTNFARLRYQFPFER